MTCNDILENRTDGILSRIRGKWRAFRSLWVLTSAMDALRFLLVRAARASEVRLRLRNPDCKIILRPCGSGLAVLLQTFAKTGCRVEKWVANPRLIVDAGANIGMTALLFARQYPTARIVAVESEPENFRRLKANTCAFPQIECVQSALWSHHAKLTLHCPDRKSWAYQARETDGTREPSCNTITLDEIVQEHGPVDLLKLDMEGAEWPLLETPPASWLDQIPVVIAELHGLDKVRRLNAALQGRGMTVFAQHEMHIFVSRHRMELMS